MRSVDVRLARGPVRCRVTSGDAGATVVLLHGIGLATDSWEPVQRALDGRATTVGFDRGGLLSALGATGSVTAAEQAAHVRALLDAGGFCGPFVLVGHSWGAAIARALADGSPDVAALVLVDGTHEELATLRGLPFRAAQRAASLLSLLPLLSRVCAVQELAGVRRSLRALRPPAVPVWAVTGGRASSRRGRRVRADFAEVYGRGPGTHVVAARAGHLVPQEAPDTVVSCVLAALQPLAVA